MEGMTLDLTKELAPYAQEQGRLYNILPAFIMAVAELETGFGSSSLCKQANNLFSIKGEFNGHSITLPTSEFIKGKWIKVNAKFRKYPSLRESVIDFCELMKNGVSWDHGIYSRAVIGQSDLEKAVYAFGRTPYMTDPSYSGKLLAVIKCRDLTKYDTLPQQHKEESHPVYKSLVDFLKANGKDSSFHSRAILASRNGIKNYSGSAAQNTALLKALGGQ
jgi:flagellum-specific peptidoglycan hydrolase FlgJ